MKDRKRWPKTCHGNCVAGQNEVTSTTYFADLRTPLEGAKPQRLLWLSHYRKGWSAFVLKGEADTKDRGSNAITDRATVSLATVTCNKIAKACIQKATPT